MYHNCTSGWVIWNAEWAGVLQRIGQDSGFYTHSLASEHRLGQPLQDNFSVCMILMKYILR
jgi:hypothetical protein